MGITRAACGVTLRRKRPGLRAGNHFMRILSVLFLITVPSAALAQKDLQTPDKGPAPPPDKMLNRFLLKEAQKHFDARRKIVGGIKTAEVVTRRQQELKDRFLEALG